LCSCKSWLKYALKARALKMGDELGEARFFSLRIRIKPSLRTGEFAVSLWVDAVKVGE